MKDFLKYTLATVAGIVLLAVIVTIIGVSSMAGMMASSETETKVRQPSLFKLTLQGQVYEQTADDPFASFMGGEQTTVSLEDLLSATEKAAANSNIKGIYLEAKGLSASPATLTAIRNALLDFKQSGKFVVSYGDSYTQADYYICSVADKVILNPQGVLDWHGLSSQSIFFTDAMKQLGVEMQIFKVGTYKSAVEPFMSTKMSDANREQVTAFLSSLWNGIVGDVSASRGLTPEVLNAYADEYLGMSTPEEVVAKGMADTLLYMDGVKEYLKQCMGEKKELHTLSLSDVKNIRKNTPLDKSGNIIAVYYAQGDIVQAPSRNNLSGSPEIASDKVIQDLKDLREDESVKAVVFRVNSGGGSAYASEQIWREITLLKEKKPVIVSMGDLAASGGYYISCAADTIVAQPNTLTGSIGIFSMFPCAEKLLSDKLQLHFDGVKTNALSDMGSFYRKMNDGESALMQKMTENGYKTFINRCADGRGKTPEAIDAIGQGRVWTGEAALELGLVDVLGDIRTAEKIAAEKAGISSYALLSYPTPQNFFAQLMNKVQRSYIESRTPQLPAEFAEELKFLRNIESMDRIQARMPYLFKVKM